MASEDLVALRVRLDGVRQAVTGSKQVERGVEGIGRAARMTSASARAMGGAVTTAASAADRSLGAVATQARRGALAVGLLAGAGVKWGLSFNAEVESARLRLGLFAKDANGLFTDIQQINLKSPFNLAGLTDAAAGLGNAGRDVAKIPKDVQAIANAAAASGKGEQALQGISIALSQIQAKGKLSQEEINQLNEAGAPGAQRIIQKAFGLTAKQVGNLGGQGLEAGKALDALTKAWTSGKMAAAAERQTRTLGGQWALFVDNARMASGAMTASLAHELSEDVLPAANRAAAAITAIFQDQDLTAEQKFRQVRKVIDRELGPIAKDAERWIAGMHLDERLGDAIEAAAPVVMNAAADVAPKAAEAFIKAWVNSGAWAQIASVLYLGVKTGAFAKAGGALAGRGGGGVAGALGGRGSTPANPVFVKDVGGNITGGASGKAARWIAPWGRAAGPAGATAAILAARHGAARDAGIKPHVPTGSFVNEAPDNIALSNRILDLVGLDRFVAKSHDQPTIHVNLQAPNVLLDGVPLAHRLDMTRAKQKARSR